MIAAQMAHPMQLSKNFPLWILIGRWLAAENNLCTMMVGAEKPTAPNTEQINWVNSLYKVALWRQQSESTSRISAMVTNVKPMIKHPSMLEVVTNFNRSSSPARLRTSGTTCEISSGRGRQLTPLVNPTQAYLVPTVQFLGVASLTADLMTPNALETAVGTSLTMLGTSKRLVMSVGLNLNVGER